MTEDQQSLFDNYENYKELEAAANRNAAAYDVQAAQQRQLAANYKKQADILARQLGFTS